MKRDFSRLLAFLKHICEKWLRMKEKKKLSGAKPSVINKNRGTELSVKGNMSCS